ncbi:uncharacterized protein LOC135379174 [Ornithodoros turicata]|uniref:uncharacterized protein LOC135379174 n=1 Tax=Ornithodoros turicata TaxID=34597 RepID=UPI00313909BF
MPTADTVVVAPDPVVCNIHQQSGRQVPSEDGPVDSGYEESSWNRAPETIIFKPSDKASTAYTFSRSSSSSLQSSSSLTPSLTTTKAQTHPLPQAAERLFVCVLKNYGVVVPDGLCGVLLLTYRHRFPHGTLTRLLIVENFTNTNPGGSCIITKCGINMILLQTTDNQALDKLASADGTKDLQWFEGLNFRHYGMLNLRIGLHTEAAITRVINYFKALREKQNQMNTRGLHIIGVTPYFYTNAPTIGDDIKEDLRRIVTEVDLDALLIRTTQTESALFEPECRLTGPSLWTHLDNLEKQVTFVQSLEFARTVQLPSDLRILLSFSCTGFRTFYKSLSAHLSHQDIDIIRHEKCRVSQLANYGEENVSVRMVHLPRTHGIGLP